MNNDRKCRGDRRCKYPTRRINIRPHGLIKNEINYLMESSPRRAAFPRTPAPDMEKLPPPEAEFIIGRAGADVAPQFGCAKSAF